MCRRYRYARVERQAGGRKQRPHPLPPIRRGAAARRVDGRGDQRRPAGRSRGGLRLRGSQRPDSRRARARLANPARRPLQLRRCRGRRRQRGRVRGLPVHQRYLSNRRISWEAILSSEDLDLYRHNIRLLQEQVAQRFPHGPAAQDILQAIGLVPRHLFVHAGFRFFAYTDNACPTCGALTTSAPSVIAEMIYRSRVRSGGRLLEVGTGTGYQAAVLAEMGGGCSASSATPRWLAPPARHCYGLATSDRATSPRARVGQAAASLSTSATAPAVCRRGRPTRRSSSPQQCGGSRWRQR